MTLGFQFCSYFLEKTRLDSSSESSDKQTIHTKCQVLYAQKDNKEVRMSSATILLRI